MSSLRDSVIFSDLPGVETPGYCRCPYGTWSGEGAVHMSCAVPTGLGSFSLTYPALKRRAIVGVPTGLGSFSLTYPALKRRAIVGVPTGLGSFSLTYPALKRRAIVGVPTGLGSFFSGLPGVETPGNCRVFLRDLVGRECRRNVTCAVPTRGLLFYRQAERLSFCCCCSGGGDCQRVGADSRSRRDSQRQRAAAVAGGRDAGGAEGCGDSFWQSGH